MNIFQRGPALYETDIEALQRRCVRSFKPSDFPVLVGDESGPIKFRLSHRPAVTRGIFKFADEPGRVDQELLWNTAADDAGTANPILFGNHHANAIACSDSRGPHAARSGSDDKQVDVVIGHPPPHYTGEDRQLSAHCSIKARGLSFSIRRASLQRLDRKVYLPNPAQISCSRRPPWVARSKTFSRKESCKRREFP